MKTETLLRGGVAMSLLTCTILMFFFAESQRKLDDSQITLKLTQDTLVIERVRFDSVYTESFQKGIVLATEEQVTDSLDKIHRGYAKERERVYNSNTFEH